MIGTRNSHTLAMHRIPPRITAAVAIDNTMPSPSCTGETRNGCSPPMIWIGSKRPWKNTRSIMPVSVFDWTMFPIPNAASAVKPAKIRPSQRAFIPRSSTYIGPPAINPFGVVMRYFTASSASEYFVAIPNTPVSHIQSTAPGPPIATAPATPKILPVPIVAASAVVNAPK